MQMSMQIQIEKLSLKVMHFKMPLQIFGHFVQDLMNI